MENATQKVYYFQVKNLSQKHPHKVIIEKLAGFIVFSINQENILEYLVLHKFKGFYEFPKGHVDEGEDLLTAAFRELEEETGLNQVKQIPNFHSKSTYTFNRGKILVETSMTLFLCQTQQKEIKLSREHNQSRWLPFEQAIKQLTFDNTRDALQKAKQFLENNINLYGN